jgi:hypothetical protein
MMEEKMPAQKSGFIQAYGKDVEIMGIGDAGCLVAHKSGAIANALTRVPYDAISWKSPDWFDDGSKKKRALWVNDGGVK